MRSEKVSARQSRGYSPGMCAPPAHPGLFLLGVNGSVVFDEVGSFDLQRENK